MKAIRAPATQMSPRARGRMSPRARAQLLSRFVLIFMCAVFLVPFYWMIVTALKSNLELAMNPPTLWPLDPQWVNFRDAVFTIPFMTFLRNTVIITALTVIGTVISNPLIAYGFSRIKWPGRDQVFFVVVATIFIPFPVVMVALFDIFARLGWINTFLPLVVPPFFGSAFFIFLMRQFLMQLPEELSDSARIDGANELQILTLVIMPLALPAIGVIAIFATVGAWGDFMGPLIYLHSERLYTLAIGLTFFQGQHDIQFNLLMAASTLVVLPVITIFIFFQRAFIEGMTLGSIK